MLQSVEIFPNARQTLRRSVAHLESEVIASCWDVPRKHRVLDLSERGMRIASGTRLRRGENVVLSFTPPGWWLHGELTVFAEVKRETRRAAGVPATMGLEFLDLPRGAGLELQHCLRGFPPPLPSADVKTRSELVWVDVLVTYTEDLGDRVNTFEVSDRMATVQAAEITPLSLGGLVTGGRKRRPYRWQHAVA